MVYPRSSGDSFNRSDPLHRGGTIGGRDNKSLNRTRVSSSFIRQLVLTGIECAPVNSTVRRLTLNEPLWREGQFTMTPDNSFNWSGDSVALMALPAMWSRESSSSRRCSSKAAQALLDQNTFLRPETLSKQAPGLSERVPRDEMFIEMISLL